MPHEPNGPPQSGGPQAYRPASPDTPDIPLADAEVPAASKPDRTTTGPAQQAASDPDGANAFSPDSPDARAGEPKAATGASEAPRPRPPVSPLQEDQIAPDEI